MRGRTIRSVMAAAIYITCREMAMSRTLNDVDFLTTSNAKNLLEPLGC